MENEDVVEAVVQEAVADQTGFEVGVEEELLIEEISIDGMCGVY